MAETLQRFANLSGENNERIIFDQYLIVLAD